MSCLAHAHNDVKSFISAHFSLTLNAEFLIHYTTFISLVKVGMWPVGFGFQQVRATLKKKLVMHYCVRKIIKWTRKKTARSHLSKFSVPRLVDTSGDTCYILSRLFWRICIWQNRRLRDKTFNLVSSWELPAQKSWKSNRLTVWKYVSNYKT